MNNPPSLSTLLSFIADSSAPFYRERYEAAGISPDSLPQRSLNELPVTTWHDIAAAPLSPRQYKEKGLLTKIVKRDSLTALIFRAQEDVVEDSYSGGGTRPLLAFHRIYEGIEAGVWYYRHNILPLIREENLEVTAAIAAKYNIDAIIGDTKTLAEFLPHLLEVHDPAFIKTVTVVDFTFNPAFIATAFPHAEARYVYAFPETGPLAHGTMSDDTNVVHFTPLPGVYVENTPLFCVTKLQCAATPIIRYEPGMHITPRTGGEDGFVSEFTVSSE